MSLLDNIGSINWASLSHAYGEASDVPKDLKALASHDEEVWDHALENLFGTIWHQGTVYEATRYAVPFLVELLESDQVLLTVRISIVHLLSSIADGHSYLAVHYPLNPEIHDKILAEQGENYSDELNKEFLDVHLARESVLAYQSVFVNLLNHRENELVCNCAMLLGSFHENASSLFSILKAKYETESHWNTKIAFLESIRSLNVASGPKLRFFREVFDKEPAVDLKSVAALSLLEIQKQDYTDDVFEFILGFVNNLDATKIDQTHYESWQYLVDVTSIRQIAQAIIALTTSAQLTAFARFIALVDASNLVLDFVQSLLFSLFPDVPDEDVFQTISFKEGKRVTKYYKRGLKEIEIPEPIENIPSKYLNVLKLIGKLDAFWEEESNLLNVFGLPHSRATLVALIQRTKG